MNRSRALLIGASFPGFREAGLFDNVNLDEFDTVLLHASAIETALASIRVSTQGLNDTKIGERGIKTLEDRFERLARWVSEGKSLFIVVSPFPSISYRSPEAVRRSSPRTVYYTASHLLFGGLRFHAMSGTLVEYCGPQAALDTFSDLTKHLHYEGFFEADEIEPLLKVSVGREGKMQMVGGFRHVSKGLIVYLPPLNLASGLTVPKIISYYDSLTSLPGLLKTPAPKIPKWASSYQISSEAAALNRISELQQQTRELETGIEQQQEIVQSAQVIKQLFVGTGEPFAAMVGEVLRALGMNVTEGPHPRADLLASDGERLFAIEAKGLEGSARESNVRQTERWVAEANAVLAEFEDISKLDAELQKYAAAITRLNYTKKTEGLTPECKGLMIIGTYRNTPLADRKDRDFPDGVETVAKRAKVCALTGLQLLGILLRARSNPGIRREIIDKLFSTDGVLSDEKDWKIFISESQDPKTN